MPNNNGLVRCPLTLIAYILKLNYLNWKYVRKYTEYVSFVEFSNEKCPIRIILSRRAINKQKLFIHERNSYMNYDG